MYENIKKAIATHEEKTLADFRAELEKKTAGELVGSWYYRQYMTPKTFEAVKALAPDEYPAAGILEKIEAKKARVEAKNTAGRLAKVEAAENAHEIQTGHVEVEFIRSRTWGYNPHAAAYGATRRTEGSASGCGYDKESTAIASALNDNPDFMRILYDHAEKGLAFPYSVNVWAGVPYFDGGCGVSCFRNVFDACGYTWEQVVNGRNVTAYQITRK